MRSVYQKAVLVTSASREGWIDSEQDSGVWKSFYVPELCKRDSILPEVQSIVILQHIGDLKWKIVK